MTAKHEPSAQPQGAVERAAQLPAVDGARMADRYSDAVASFTELARALAEHESVPEALQSILALILRLVPGCHAASCGWRNWR